MDCSLGSYVLHFENGGLEVRRDGECLYFNRRPIYVSVKDYGGRMIFRDIPYETVEADGDAIAACGTFVT